jgi:hypothetical protein
MSTRHWALTTGAMAAGGLVLRALGPDLASLAAALRSPQHVADTFGPDVLVLTWAALLAWAVWAWGTLGLALTAAPLLPGAYGGTARLLLAVLLPAGARRVAAVALGVGLGVGLGSSLVAPASASPALELPVGTAPDWPRPTGELPPEPGRVGTVPDWPTAPAAAPVQVPGRPPTSSGAHVVVRGDCLWDIAADRLLRAADPPPTDQEVAAAVHAWWVANAGVIGPDPDLLLPGQVLRPPPSS